MLVNNQNPNVLLFFMLMALLLDTAVAADTDPLGKTILARGKITAERNNAEKKLKRLSPVYRQDTLRSGTNARAQFRMVDNALINLQENSVLRLHAYELTNPNGEGSVLMELLSGGLRTITGAIGKKNKKDYQLRTPSATIGIRGTMYEVEIVSNGMYVGAWKGSINVRSHSGKCNINLGDSFKSRFVFIDAKGKCRTISNVPEVFKQGHSSSVHAVVNQIEAKIDPLLERPNRKLPFRGIALGQGTVSVANGQADTISSPNPVIETDNNGVVSAETGVVSGFAQNINGFPVSWGRWGEYAVSPDLNGQASPVEDDNGLIWSTYNPSATDIVSARTGRVRYDNMVSSLAQSSMGDVTSVSVQMDVDFDQGAITNGALSAQVPSYTWVGAFDGRVEDGQLALGFNGGALVNAQTGVFTDASGTIEGGFVGDNAQGITGGFSLIDEANSAQQIEGVFLIEQGQ